MLPYLLGLLIFAALNILMLQYHYELWTNPRVGFWSVFHKYLCMSGFDPHTYVTVSQWRPSWTLLRHPLLADYMWPLSKLNEWLMAEYHINCAIIIIGCLWTLIGTLSWTILYKILRRIQSLSVAESLLLCLFFYSFAYVMLATFVADHMLITMTILLLALYVSGKAQLQKRTVSTWKMLVLFFLSTGVTTTNCVKHWLIDIITRWPHNNIRQLFVHSLKYIPVALLLLALYVWQDHTIIANERKSIERQERQHIAQDKAFADKVQKLKVSTAERKSKQLSDNKLFEYTDNSIGRVPSLVHNIFGEGIQLHEDYLLKDVNRDERPVIVAYKSATNYIAEALVFMLFVAGIWCGRRSLFLWTVMSCFLFDMLLHVGLCFAAADVYIMTAHWAYVIPIAISYLFIKYRDNQTVRYSISALICALTIWLWAWNLHLIVPYILY